MSYTPHLRMLLAAAALGAASAFAQPAPIGATENSDVPAARLALLTRGVNLGNWFSQAPFRSDYQHDYLRSWIQPDEFVALRAAGFRHVRFPVEFEMFFDPAHPDTLRPEFLGDFDSALENILDAGLAVIVDFHAREDTKKRLNTDDAFIPSMAGLWGAMARHLAGRDPERVFLETMNEPSGGMSWDRWLTVQNQLLAAMRAGAPRHTIIVTGDKWSEIDELVKLTPYPDRDIIYNFHFYEPITFTHQGASWMKTERQISGLLYPVNFSNRDAVIAMLKQKADAAGADSALEQTIGRSKKAVEAYAADRKVATERFALARDWGRKYGVPLTCNEFGVIVPGAQPASRSRWLRDVRETCEADGIGWCLWDYCGTFRIAFGGHPGQRKLDPSLLAALGLPGSVSETQK